MTRTIPGLAVALSAIAIATTASADLLAYWNQNNNGLPVSGFGFTPSSFPQAADSGVGSATLSVGGGLTASTIVNGNGTTVYEWVESFAGSTLNALNGDAAGGSISLEGGTGSGNNGAYFQFAFNMSGYQDLAVSYAVRGTSSGFTTHTWAWSTDGVSFTDFGSVSGTNVSTYFVATLNTLTALDNASTAFLRLTFTGATTSSGNNRLDNIQFNASAIPAPGAIALLGVAGLAAGRRRRA